MRNKIFSVAFVFVVANAGLFACGSSKSGGVDSAAIAGSGGAPGDDAAAGGVGGGTAGTGGTVAEDGGTVDSSVPMTDGAAGAGGAGGSGGCPPSTATTHVDIINGCTTAQAIDKVVKLPGTAKVGDPLPPLQ